MAEEWGTVTIGGVDYWEIETARFRIPKSLAPGQNMFLAVAQPDGGSGAFPAILQGETGPAPDVSSTINLTALEYDDADPDAASWTETAPDTYELNLTLHKGPPGDDGDTVLDPTDFGTPVAGKILVVNPAADDLVYATQKVGDRYTPATIVNAPSGNTSYTLCSVAVAAQDFDWRPVVSGQTVVTGTGADVRVDVIARLNNAAAGNVVGCGFGVPGAGPTTVALSDGPPAGSADSYDRVAAGVAAVIYLRVERQSGTDTFTTSASTTTFSVKVAPIP